MPYSLPPASPGGGYNPSPYPGVSQGAPQGIPPGGYPGAGYGQPVGFAVAPTPKKNRGALIITVVAVVVVVAALVVWLVVRNLEPGTQVPPSPKPPTSTGTTHTPPVNPSTTDCVFPPTWLTDGGDVYPIPADDRVHAGGLSFPAIGSPWYCPFDYGDDSDIGNGLMQYYVLPELDSKMAWGPNIVVGTSLSNSSSAQNIAESVVAYTLDNWYSDKDPQTRQISSEAVTLGGVTGWKTVAEVDYSDDRLYDTYDTITVVVLPVDRNDFGVVLASVPNTTPSDQDDQITAALADIQVD